jgi:hypothetical protein
MRISAHPRRATLSFCAEGGSNQSALVLECIASNGAAVIEIGKRHVFASRRNRKILSRRRSCDLKVWIKRQSSLSGETLKQLNLNRDKVGELSFVPPIRKDDFSSAQRGCLEAFVFLADSEFEVLLNAFVSGKRPAFLVLELEWEPGDRPLQFGWEPDGSRIEWKLDDSAEAKPASANIAGLTMAIELFR